MPTLLPYQQKFISFLVHSGVLIFGEFTLKSGRKAPYFVNTGNFNDGSKIAELGSFYAAHLMQCGLGDTDVVFGPAYKGIPLCVTTAIALSKEHGKCVGFSFDRKEAKDHGDKGIIVGTQIKDGTSMVLVEDVITAGTTLHKIVPFMRELARVDIKGVIVSVDRCERGKGELSAAQEASQELGIKIFPIVTIHDIVAYLSGENESGMVLSSEIKTRIESYLREYGAKV